jgi:hypothetical protein
MLKRVYYLKSKIDKGFRAEIGSQKSYLSSCPFGYEDPWITERHP